MSPLDDFKQFIKDAESRNDQGVIDPKSQFAKWAHDNPGELSRWEDFRDSILNGGRPNAPNMLTAHGKELIDAGVLYLHWTAPVPVSPPPVITNTLPPVGVLRMGGNNFATATNKDKYGIVGCGIADVDACAKLPGRPICYADAVDLPAFFTSVDRQEAINKGWTLELEGDKTTYLMDIGNKDYQDAVISEWDAFLAQHFVRGNGSGFYWDDTIVSLDNYYGIAQWPQKYPTPIDWYTALAAFVVRVGSALKAKGWYVGANAIAFFPQNRGVFPGADSNNGTSMVQWINMLAPGLSFVMIEDWLHTNGATRTEYVGSTSTFPSYWGNWRNLHNVCKGLGLDLVPTINTSDGDDPNIVYTVATFLLDWKGSGGGVFVFGSNDPWRSTWTKTPGNAMGPASSIGVGWARDFENVKVRINPHPTQSQVFDTGTLAPKTATLI